MERKLLMGNQAIAYGAIRAGVGVVTGYPGTPSTEVLETIAAENPGNIYVEWSVNEKSALEVAAGAAYTGRRSLVTMKQVGLNVASDPLMSLAYVGVKGGMVVFVADDPGPISSQTEQDTRHFAQYSKLPVFDPSSPEEAYYMMEDAFQCSEEYGTPVLFRATTRICHACADIPVEEFPAPKQGEGFERDPSRWVIFPRLSYQSHQKIEARNPQLGERFSHYRYNELRGDAQGKKGIVTGGISDAYAREALSMLGENPKQLKIATPHPFPESLALEFLKGLDQVLVLEELDPVLEQELVFLCGKHQLKVEILGKLTGNVQCAGENTVESVKGQLSRFLQVPQSSLPAYPAPPSLPVRPPVLCAGCPHRASFYAVKQAMKGKKAVFCGDIGCYTLGNAQPLDMVDTCLCMGAGITIAQGIARADGDTVPFAFVGDSTFFHTGIPGVVNAVYNGTKLVLIVLDNATTAMTGHQPHPGTGKTMMGEVSRKASIPKVLEAIGVGYIRRVDPLDLPAAIQTVQEAAGQDGVSAVIFESPCIAVTKPAPLLQVDREKCVGCMKCIRELGCPALVREDKKAAVDPSLCYGCGICQTVCPTGAIGRPEMEGGK